jgi:hypothetical protein
MAIGDSVGKQAVDELTVKTVPEIIAGLHELLDRLNGAKLVLDLPSKGFVLQIPPKTA